jgi:hypothetical protein
MKRYSSCFHYNFYLVKLNFKRKFLSNFFIRLDPKTLRILFGKVGCKETKFLNSIHIFDIKGTLGITAFGN